MSEESRRRKYYQQVPKLNPNDAGFVRDLTFEPVASNAAPLRSIGHDAKQIRQHTVPSQLPDPKRRRLVPTAAQRLSANGLGLSAAADISLTPEGVLAAESESDAEDAALAEFAQDAAFDILAALQLLRSEFPKAALMAGRVPLMLKSQLYTVIPDRTAADRQLELLRSRNEVRSFKLASGQGDEYAFMFTSDYASAVRKAATASLNKEQQYRATCDTSAAVVAEWFMSSVVPNCREVSIKRRQLLSLLSVAQAAANDRPASQPTAPSATEDPSAPGQDPTSAAEEVSKQMRPRISRSRAAPAAVGSGGGRLLTAGRTAKGARLRPVVQRQNGMSSTERQQQQQQQQQQQGRKHGNTGEVTEKHVAVLLNLGLLARHPTDRDIFLFGIPDAGPLMMAIRKGREELLGLITRRKYSEIFEKELMTGRVLQRSNLDMRFHVRDLIGLGQLHRVATTSGPLLRARKL